MEERTLGFVGLGKMGAPMSARLAAGGWPLTVFDAAGTENRMPAGAVAATSAAEVATRADIVLLSLPDGAASKAVCAEIGGAAPRRADFVVDLSTIGIRAARECAEMLRVRGIAYVDAPVSGGVAGARAGSLALMAGVEPSVFEQLLPVLSVLARNCFRVGDAPGQGQAMKLLNNFISATALAATSEAVIFGATQGLDLAGMIEVINSSSGRTTASVDKFPRSVISRTYDFGFSGSLMAKDVALYMESVEAANVLHDVGEAVARLWERFSVDCPGTDFTYIHKYLEDRRQK